MDAVKRVLPRVDDLRDAFYLPFSVHNSVGSLLGVPKGLESLKNCPLLLAGAYKALVRHRRSFETSSPGRARSNKKRRCLIPLSEHVEQLPALPPPTHISALPTDVLVKIFSKLDLKLHRFVLPLVCRQW